MRPKDRLERGLEEAEVKERKRDCGRRNKTAKVKKITKEIGCEKLYKNFKIL